MDATLPSPRRRDRAKLVAIDQLLGDDNQSQLTTEERQMLLQLRSSGSTISHTQRLASPGPDAPKPSSSTASPAGSFVAGRTDAPHESHQSPHPPHQAQSPKPVRLPDMELLNLSSLTMATTTSASAETSVMRQSSSGIDATLASPRFKRAEVSSPALGFNKLR